MTAVEIETETKKGRDRDYWVGETRTINGKELWVGHHFVHYGKKYAVTKTGETICTGSVAETYPNGGETSLTTKTSVVTPADKEIIPPQPSKGIMLQPQTRGRPRKLADAPVCRMTEWRRRKKLQGVLL